MADLFFFLPDKPLADREPTFRIELQMGFAGKAVVLDSDLIVERVEKVVENGKTSKLVFAASLPRQVGNGRNLFGIFS